MLLLSHRTSSSPASETCPSSSWARQDVSQPRRAVCRRRRWARVSPRLNRSQARALSKRLRHRDPPDAPDPAMLAEVLTECHAALSRTPLSDGRSPRGRRRLLVVHGHLPRWGGGGSGPIDNGVGQGCEQGVCKVGRSIRWSARRRRGGRAELPLRTSAGARAASVHGGHHG